MILRFLLLVVILLAAVALVAKPVDAHFFGATKDVDGYQVVFQPYPQAPVVGTNSTLNFSVLQNGSNIYNVYCALIITEKASGQVVYQNPYRLYETSDITVPYRFDNVGDYVVTLQTRIAGHEKYQSQPLVASFDISAFAPGIPFDELLLYYVTPAAAAMVGIVVYLHSKGKM